MIWKLEEVVINDLRLFHVILVEAQLAKKVTGTISLALAPLVVLRFGWGWSRSRSWGRSRTRIRGCRGWSRSRTTSRTRRGKFRKLPAACRIWPVLALVAVSISSDLVDLTVGIIVTVAAVIGPFEPGYYMKMETKINRIYMCSNVRILIARCIPLRSCRYTCIEHTRHEQTNDVCIGVCTFILARICRLLQGEQEFYW